MIDVILPIYKPDETVYQAVDSVIAQTYTDWHLYIIDDASKDGTLKKIKDKYSIYPDKITYFQFDENKRAAACRNYAIKHGKGVYIAFIDQDDIWLSNKLELQINCFKSNEVDAVHGNVQFIDNDNNIILEDKCETENQARRVVNWDLPKEELAKQIFLKPNIRIISSMVKRNIFEKIRGFKDQFFGGEDETFWFELALEGKIDFLDEILFYRRIHNSNSVNTYEIERLYGHIKAIESLKGKYDYIISDVIEAKLKEKYFTLFRRSIQTRNPDSIFLSFSKLLFKYPIFMLRKTAYYINKVYI